MTAQTELPLSAPVAASLPPPASRRWLWLTLRFTIPLVLLGYLLARVSLAELLSGLRAVSLSTISAVAALMTFNLGLAAVRWRVTLLACGVVKTVPVLELFRLHWIGAFYSACVPGGVGGEVVRALATRSLFDKRSFTAALGVTLLERLLGMCGLLMLVTTAFVAHPLPGMPDGRLWGVAGASIIAVVIGGILSASRLARLLPSSLQRVVQAIPRIVSLRSFGLGLVMSICTQLVSSVIGHLVVADISPHVTLAQSLVIMPMIFASAFFPLTVGGAGVRELAFVALYGLVGVSRADALAASLVVMAMQFAFGASGGIVQMLRPLDVTRLDE